MKCSFCGSRDIDFQESSGQQICCNCGRIIEENTIVSSLEFEESGDRSHVIGQFVSADGSKPMKSSSRLMNRYASSGESREITLANARRVIQQVASNLRLPSLYVDRAFRLYSKALQLRFLYGRQQTHVVATCLYTICRLEKSPHLLIDFSDALQVNVYVLGKSFLEFSRLLSLQQQLSVVDPALFIHRFASRLELGEKLNTVVTTTLRIITRMKKDWIVTGRRPDGICAAAILIACRCHGLEKSCDEIAKLFRISSETLKSRLEDFRATPAAQLTSHQLLTQMSSSAETIILGDASSSNQEIINPAVESDPPSFSRNQAQKKIDNDADLSSEPRDDIGESSKIPSKLKATRLRQKESMYETIYADVAHAAADASDPAALAEFQKEQSAISVRIRNGVTEHSFDDEKSEWAVKTGDAAKTPAAGRDVSDVFHLSRVTGSSSASSSTNFDDLSEYVLTVDEQEKRSAIFEKSHRVFLDDRKFKRSEKQRLFEENGGQRGRKKKADSSSAASANAVPTFRREHSFQQRLADDSSAGANQNTGGVGGDKKRSKKINYDLLKAV